MDAHDQRSDPPIYSGRFEVMIKERRLLSVLCCVTNCSFERIERHQQGEKGKWDLIVEVIEVTGGNVPTLSNGILKFPHSQPTCM